MNQDLITKKEAKLRLKSSNNKLVDESLDSFVRLHNINKIYPNGVQAVFDFNLEINKHDFVALVGPSGCGKSTTLRMIAGLEEISSGELYINKVYSNYLPSKDRDIAMVFQSYALYPQLSVYENIAFGLKIRNIDKKEIEDRVMQAADILDLGHYLDRKPKELSGGQMQRVALGRAIVRQADLFLMDELLSNLDAKLRVQMRSELVRIHREVGATTIYVTHDQVEAMTMANVIVVMNKGFIQQTGKAIDVYNNPCNLFVATFIGSPCMNIIEGIYKDNKICVGDDYYIEVDDNFKSVLTKFRITKQTEIREALNGDEKLLKQMILRMKSNQVYKKSTDVIVKHNKKKKGFIKAIIAKFKNKKSDIISEQILKDRDLLESMLAQYLKPIDSGIDIKVGIRPETFDLVNNFKGKKMSKVIKAKPSLIEILGDEYIVHFNLFGEDIQIKLDTTADVDMEKEMEIVFDLDRIHFFDVESGLAIK